MSGLIEAMNRFTHRVWLVWSWIFYAGLVSLAYGQGQKWLSDGTEEGVARAKIAFLAVALLIAMPGVFKRLFKKGGWLLFMARALAVPVLLILGGTTLVDRIVKEGRLDPAERAALNSEREMREREKARIEGLLRSEEKEARLKEREDVDPTYAECVDMGMQWFKEIGAYPSLSSGKSAIAEAREKCTRTTRAFGPWE